MRVPPTSAMNANLFESLDNRQARIVSVSRRTDVPALYADWFSNRLAAGRVSWRNPFNRRLYTLSLEPNLVSAFVFWSKNFTPFLPIIPRLEDMGYASVFHFTITGLPSIFEPRLPPLEERIAAFGELARFVGQDRIFWRYDPILLSDITGETYHKAKFHDLCGALEGLTSRCYVSFPSLYAKVRRGFSRLLEKQGLRVIDPTTAARKKLLHELAEIAARRRIRLYACCSPELVDRTILPAACIDAEAMRHLFPERRIRAGRNPTRKGCGCSQSKDIGEYNTCTHGCVYCYANSNPKGAETRFQQHDPASETMIP